MTGPGPTGETATAATDRDTVKLTPARSGGENPDPSSFPSGPNVPDPPIGQGVTGVGRAAPPLPGAGVREQCPTCGAPTAADQRYCVECGQRLAAARPLFMREGAQRAAPAAEQPGQSQSRWRMTPNSTLIAGIGTLLLAMGVGVLIGHLGQSSSPAHTSTPIVTIPSTGVPGTATTATTPTPTTSTGASSTGSKSSAAAAAAAAKSTQTGAKPTKAAAPPANPTVTVGQKGSGKGYQHGHFTGHFFGGESEEEANEEPSESAKGKSGASTNAGKNGKSGKSGSGGK